MKKILFLFLLVCQSVSAKDLKMDIAVLRGMDKLTGRVSTFSVPVGQTGQFGKTFVAVESCFTRPPEESPENSAFLFVYEKTLKGDNVELFKGWMFSSQPALSAMENPVYDIWLIECQKSSAQLEDERPEPVLDESENWQAMETLPDTQAQASQAEEVNQVPTPLVPTLVEMEDF